MEQKSIEQIKAELSERLGEARFYHSLCVADKAKEYAEKYGIDPEKAYFTGLIHDVCKKDSVEHQLQMKNDFGIIFTDYESNSPKLWHAILGAEYARRHYTTDEEVISAIRYHTTGRRGMSLLDKIIYVADCVGEDRTYDGIELVREIADQSLEAAIAYMCQYTIQELLKQNHTLHPDTVDAYNEWSSLLEVYHHG